MKASKVNMIPMKTVKPEPPNQGTVRIDSKTIALIPANVVDVEARKASILEKHAKRKML